MVIFRENTEDVYSGIEWEEGSGGARELIEFLRDKLGKRVREDSGIGIKPISRDRQQAAGAQGARVRRRLRGAPT